MKRRTTRRGFIEAGGIAAGSFFVGRAALAQEGAEANEHEEEEVAPAEDLMREHGVLKRCILIYREGLRRIDANADLPIQTITDTAQILRSFIEDYHEKLEEDFLFPRFKMANLHTDLVSVLEAQHQAGRRQTDVTLRLANLRSLRNADERRQLGESMRLFIRMYEPHEAREDTVLFPALRRIISANEYAALGEDFEKKEHELFGAEGFEGIVDQVATLEKSLGIYELAQFTPK